MRPLKTLFITSLFVILTACTQPATDLGNGGGSGGGGSGGISPGGSSAITVDEKYVACTVSSDCKVLEVGCCDVCNGGAGISVNKAFADEAYSKYKQSCSPDWACTLMACLSPPVAYCKEKKCAFLKSPTLVGQCLKDDDCVVVKENSCCNNCDASVTAINKEFVELYPLPQFTEANCGGVICTEEPCPESAAVEWSAICNNSYCLTVAK